MTICLCASVSAYEKVIAIKHELESLGHRILAPTLAEKMEAEGSFEKLLQTAQHENEHPAVKGKIMREHFEKIAVADAILVVNEAKHGVTGYVGPNVLIELGIAFFLRKKLFLLNELHPSSPMFDEVHGMNARTILSDFSQLQ